MKRSTPLRRRKRLNPRRKKPRRRPEGYMVDTGYSAEVRAIGQCWTRVWLARQWEAARALPYPECLDAEAELERRFWKHAACTGPLESDHLFDWDRGLGQKARTASQAPMCLGHHRQREDWKGFFWTFTRQEMRSFCEDGAEWAVGSLHHKKAEVAS